MLHFRKTYTANGRLLTRRNSPLSRKQQIRRAIYPRTAIRLYPMSPFACFQAALHHFTHAASLVSGRPVFFALRHAIGLSIERILAHCSIEERGVLGQSRALPLAFLQSVLLHFFSIFAVGFFFLSFLSFARPASMRVHVYCGKPTLGRRFSVLPVLVAEQSRVLTCLSQPSLPLLLPLSSISPSPYMLALSLPTSRRRWATRARHSHGNDKMPITLVTDDF